MLATDPQREFEALTAQITEQIGKTFPVQDRTGRFEVRVSDLEIQDKLGTDDIKGQHQTRMEGKSWAVPVSGKVSVVDTTTGKTLVERKMQLAKIPKQTRHYTYIVGGQEKSIANQWRLRPGPYIKPTMKPGEYEAQFQLAKGRPFDIQVSESGYLHVLVGGRKVPLYSLLHASGVSDDTMKANWGADTFAASKAKANVDKDLKSFYTAWRKEPPREGLDLRAEAKAILEGTKMDPLVSHANLGVKSDTVTPEVLFSASKKLIDVSAGRAHPDPIDSLRYKELWTAKDQFSDRLEKATDEITGRMQRALGRQKLQNKLLAGDSTALRDVVMPDLLQRPLYHGVFTTSLTSNGKQTNPLSMYSDHSLVTITGPGGIQNKYQIAESNTAIDPSHLGFLDPVFTPESDPGVNTHLAFGVKIHERKPHVRLYNLKTGKPEHVDAATASVSHVVLPDQVKWTATGPKPLGEKTRMSDSRGEIRDDLPWSKAEYILPSHTQMFAPETNLVPFMQNDSAGRSTMSARHMGQAISIIGREPPLVQVHAGAGHTFEEVLGGGFLSHRTRQGGVVESVSPDEIVVRDADGKLHRTHLYNHYPTNHEKGMLHSTPLVKVGDKVKQGQIVADNNHTKNGVLALGTNIRVAYLANGLNHEDGIVISESAAKKLASEHLYKPSMLVSDNHIIGKKAFLLAKEGVYGKDRLEKIGDDGIVKKGTVVKPGDPIVLALSESTKPESIDSSTLTRLGAKLRNKYSNATMTWDGDYEGEVIDIARRGKDLVVHIKTREPAQVGSKLSNRHGAKGIVTEVMADKDMPHDSKGKHVEALFNPVGVIGRMNPGQILETAAAKIAEKTGKPYIVKNFEPGVDYLKKLQGELKEHGLTDTEVLFDPKTGRKLGAIMAGPHYVIQLEHQVDKKTHVRSGGRQFKHLDMPQMYYDADTKIPKGGGHTGAQSLGSLGVYAGLAAGIHDNLQEMQTLKSDQTQAMDVWGALTSGELLPPPRVPFVTKKFEHLLTGLGVQVVKSGSEIKLLPGSDKITRNLSRGELTRAEVTVRGKSDQPMKGGLFDTHITGGPAGTHWGHIELVESFPNPVFSRAIAHTLGIKEADIPAIVEGKKELPGGYVGGKGFKDALAKLDVDKELKAAKAVLDDPNTKGTALNKANFKFKALRTLKETGTHPKDAWTIQAIPVLPPLLRPQSTLSDGTIRNNPLNSLYRRLAMTNSALKRSEKHVPWDASLDSRAGLYQELQNLFGTTAKGKKALDLDMRGTREDPNKTLPGILHIISGDQPKDGFFQDKMIGKKQDYTARGTIVADPTLGVDEISIPKKIAIELMRPMVARHLITGGYGPDEAQLMVSQKHPVAMKALEKEVQNRPILLKRDPVLHQYGIVGQKIKLTDSHAIKVNPLILPPIGGDLDGDTVALFVPLGHGAVQETHGVMPSQRPISTSTGEVMFAPSNESALSIYRASIPRGKSQAFASAEAAEAAFKSNKLDLSTPVDIHGVGSTTLGRVRLAAVVPEKYKNRVLTRLDEPIGKKMQAEMLRDTAMTTPKHFADVVDGMNRLGFKMAYESGHTIGLKDLEPLRVERDAIVGRAAREVAKMDPNDREAVVKKWFEATKDIQSAYSSHYAKHPTNASDMAASGIKAKPEQFQGALMAPMLVEDHWGMPSRVPLTKSFSEGIDSGGYFLQAAGARRGLLQKVKSTSQPGYMSKMLVQAGIDHPITSHDCGTPQGITMSVKEKDIVDRRLAQPLKLGTLSLPAGTAVTPEILAHAAKERVPQLVVRSPLKCRMPQGVCSHCMGVHHNGGDYKLGENVGLIAAQALGERATQLMLKKTHGAGIVTSIEKGTDDFGTVQAVVEATERGRTDALVAPGATKVLKIEGSKRGGWNMWFQGKRAPVYTTQKPLTHVVVGYEPTKGEVLTHGEPNIHDVLSTQGLEATQNHIVNRIGNIYAKEGILRRHVELAVRNSTGLVRVTDSGGHDSILRGDYMMKPVVDELNRTTLKGKEPIRAVSELKSTMHLPLHSQKDWIARLQGERIVGAITRAAQHGHTSTLGGTHPIPTLAYGASTRPKAS